MSSPSPAAHRRPARGSAPLRALAALLAAALLALAAATGASAAPTPGDRAAERALGATATLEKRQDVVVRAYRRTAATRRIAPTLRQTRILTTRATALARRIKRTRPTSGPGKRIRRSALQIAGLYRQWSATAERAARAAVAGRTAAANRLARRADRLNRLIDRRRDAAEKIVVPDPAADVSVLEVVGFVVASDTSSAGRAPVAAPPGGTITACTASQRAIGVRYVVRGVTGRIRVAFALIGPDGVPAPFPGIIAEPGVEGRTFTASISRNVTNGVYRWQASVNGRVILDAAVTRQCS
jgi:hypothetical protein